MKAIVIPCDGSPVERHDDVKSVTEVGGDKVITNTSDVVLATWPVPRVAKIELV